MNKKGTWKKSHLVKVPGNFASSFLSLGTLKAIQTHAQAHTNTHLVREWESPQSQVENLSHVKKMGLVEEWKPRIPPS